MNPHSHRVQPKPAFPAQTLGNRKDVASLPAIPQTAASEQAEQGAQPFSNLDEGDRCREKFSSCGDSEGHVPVADQVCPSHFRCVECSAVLHELSNVMTGVLTNAQLLGWKLPPYSHLKRSVRELERGAQRGGELLRRLKERFPER